MILQQLKVAAAVVALALGCGFAGFAIEQRLNEPRTIQEKVVVQPSPPETKAHARPLVPAHRSGRVARHHHTPHPQAGDDIADVLNRGQL